jgi:hypothetical protein
LKKHAGDPQMFLKYLLKILIFLYYYIIYLFIKWAGPNPAIWAGTGQVGLGRMMAQKTFISFSAI